MRKNIDDSFNKKIYACDKHIEKLNDARGYLKNIMPLTVEKMTFLDILNRLEKLDILDKNRWLELREVRNEIAHEYSFNQDEVVDNINLIYDKTDELILVYKDLYKFIELIDE